MGHSAGLRAGTRYAFARGFKKTGVIPLSVYLQQYRVGDIVDVVCNGAVQKGMPYKVYHGKTGVIYNVTKSSVGVILHKPVGNRYLEKRINVRIEHVRLSRSREDFLRRVKENAAKKAAAKKDGKKVEVKRHALLPREARTVKLEGVETITPIPYETTI